MDDVRRQATCAAYRLLQRQHLLLDRIAADLPREGAVAPWMRHSRPGTFDVPSLAVATHGRRMRCARLSSLMPNDTICAPPPFSMASTISTTVFPPGSRWRPGPCRRKWHASCTEQTRRLCRYRGRRLPARWPPESSTPIPCRRAGRGNPACCLRGIESASPWPVAMCCWLCRDTGRP